MQSGLLTSRAAAILAGIAIVLGVIVSLAGDGAIVVLSILLTDGLLAAAWIASAGALGSLARRMTRCGVESVTGSLSLRERARVRGGMWKAFLRRARHWYSHPHPNPLPEGEGVSGTSPLPEREGAHGSRSESKLQLAPALVHGTTSIAMGLGLQSLIALLLGLSGALSFATALLLLLLPPVAWAVLRIGRTGKVGISDSRSQISDSKSEIADLKSKIQNPKSKIPNPSPLLDFLNQPARWSWTWLVPAAFLGIAIVGAAMPPGILWRPHDPHPYDILEYHLQIPREWFEAGRIAPLPHNVFGFFPFNLEMQFLLAMHVRGGPWAGMYLAQFLTLAHMVLAVVAVAGAMPAGLSRAIAALAMCAAPWLTLLSCVAYNESGLLLYGSLAVIWVLRAVPVEGVAARPCAVMAGVFAGLAAGSKYTAVPLLLAALPILLIIVARSRCSLRAAGWFVAGGCIVLLPWLIRNAIWTGNPVFPEGISLLGAGHFTPEQVTRWEAAHSPRADQRSMTARLDAADREILRDWRYGYALLPLAAIAVGWSLRPGTASDKRALILLTALFASLLLFWLFFTHMQSRFFVLAIPLAAMLIGRADWGRAARPFVAIILSGASLVGLAGVGSELSTPAGLGIFGLSDYGPLLHPRIAEAIAAGKPIALVGEAQAFLYQAPMSRLRYRTVFDVPAKPERTLAEIWLADPPRPDELEVVNIGELRRLARTYGLPQPAPPSPAPQRIILGE